MKYAQTWHREISPNSSKILAFVFICIFILYQFFILAQLRANKFTQGAQAYLKKAEAVGEGGLTVEQAVFYKRAIRFFSRCIKSNPLDAGAYFNYAETLSSKIDQGQEWLKVLDLESMDSDRRGQGVNLSNLARRNFIEALKRNPTNAIYHQRLASIYEKLSDDVQAEAELKKAAMLDPQNVSIHLYLTQYYLSRNKQSEFNYHLGRVVELYKLVLTGGGPMERLGRMVIQYLESINRADLIKDE